MILCPGSTITPPNEKSRILIRIINILIVLQIFAGFAKIVFSVWSFALCLLSSYVLFVAVQTLNYCNCAAFIMISLFDGFVNFVAVCEEIMKGLNFFEEYQLLFIVVGSVFIQTVTIYFAFLGYKEFKGICYDVMSQNLSHSMTPEKQTLKVKESTSDREKS